MCSLPLSPSLYGLLFYKNLLYVPDGSPRLQVLEHCHDAPMAGHFGIAKTMELVKRSFWWPHLQNFVEDYVVVMLRVQWKKK